MEIALAHNLEPAVYTKDGVQEALRAVLRAPGTPVWPLHLKVDTGMHAWAALPTRQASPSRRGSSPLPGLALEGVWTHSAVADDPADPFTAEQVRRFDEVLAALEGARGSIPGDAGTRRTRRGPWPARRLDQRPRTGRDRHLNGVPPSPRGRSRPAQELGLRPALRLVSEG